MRVLVAGRNAKVLATAAGAFANDLQIQTATTKAASFALLERTEFDLIVACETLGDGSGLEVLSQVAVNAPNTLRIFAARPSTLNLLKGELGLFGLFRTLPYPINFRKLWAAINLARSTCADGQPARGGNGVKHVVLEDGWQPARQVTAARVRPDAGGAKRQQPARAPNAPVTAARTGGRLPAPQVPKAPATAARTAAKPSPQGLAAPAARRPDTSGIRAAARYAAAHAEPVPQNAAAKSPAAPARPKSRKPAPIPQSEAFRRALARRNASKLEANSQFGTAEQLHATSQILGVSRREPGMSNDSLAQLAKLATTQRSAYNLRGVPAGKKRAAFVVGSGVFAATTAAVLTFFMINANNSMDRSKLPLIASINRPVPNKVFPWQPQVQQPTRPPATFIRSESSAPAAADLEVEAEAASENFEVEPGHPGPPQPNPPPPSSEPPSLESPAEPVDE
jgi:hypothetical protein